MAILITYCNRSKFVAYTLTFCNELHTYGHETTFMAKNKSIATKSENRCDNNPCCNETLPLQQKSVV